MLRPVGSKSAMCKKTDVCLGLRDRVTHPSILTVSMLPKRTTKLVCEIYVPAAPPEVDFMVHRQRRVEAPHPC